MAESTVSEELWDEFHELVNMTSRELREWLLAEGARETSEELPDQAGPELGRHVLEVLGKRRADVTGDDVAVMQKVVRRIRDARGFEPEPTAGDAHWRHRLMDVGHDPLKPV